jgi:hypothetical protein
MVWSYHGELMQDVLSGRTRSRGDGGGHRRLVRFFFKWRGPGLTSMLLLAGWLVLEVPFARTCPADRRNEVLFHVFSRRSASKMRNEHYAHLCARPQRARKQHGCRPLVTKRNLR